MGFKHTIPFRRFKPLRVRNNLSQYDVVETRVSLTKSDKFIYQTNRHQVGHRTVTSFA